MTSYQNIRLNWQTCDSEEKMLSPALQSRAIGAHMKELPGSTKLLAEYYWQQPSTVPKGLLRSWFSGTKPHYWQQLLLYSFSFFLMSFSMQCRVKSST